MRPGVPRPVCRADVVIGERVSFLAARPEHPQPCPKRLDVGNQKPHLALEGSGHDPNGTTYAACADRAGTGRNPAPEPSLVRSVSSALSSWLSCPRFIASVDSASGSSGVTPCPSSRAP